MSSVKSLVGPRRRLVGAALFLSVGVLAFVSGVGATLATQWVTAPASTAAPRVDPRVVKNFRVAIATSSTPTADGRVTWTATWTLCWDPIAGAIGYDVQPLTSESASQRLRKVTSTCYAVDVAAGEDLPADVSGKRDTQIAVQRAQVGYRVRADFGGNVVSAWSEAIDAGATGRP
jgi:hypothetical protein